MSHAGRLTWVAVCQMLLVGCGTSAGPTASTPTADETSARPTLRIDAFTVTGFMEGTSYAYWPQLTLTASPGSGRLRVTRLQVDPPGRTGTFRPHGGSWLISAGSTVALFHSELFYGEPEYYLTSPTKFDQLSVTVSYVDDASRGADVVAVAPVVR